ncbi:MAG: pitrilysin family protein [Balneolales bacterium]
MKRILSFSLIWLAAGFSLLGAQTPYDELTYPELNSYQMPEIVTFELDNGIRFYLVEDNELPLINLNMIVKAGSFLIPNDKAGLAGLTTQVMRSGGTENHPGEELNELLENRAAQMELGMGLSSGSGSMNVLKEDFAGLLPVFIDLIKNPAFPQDKIELAKTQARSSISRRNDDAQSVASREFGRLIYGEESLYGRLTGYETLNNIDRADFVDFHNTAFTGQNLMIGVTGDFSTDEMKRMLTEAFSGYPEGTENELDLPEVDYTFNSSINFIDKPDVNQSVIFMGHIGGLRENPDYAALQAMNEILSGGFSGRLFQIVRSEMGLAYGVFGNYQSNIQYKGQFYAGISTRSSATAEAIRAVRDQIKRLQEERVGEDELEETKERILNSLVFRYDSKSKVLRERMSYEYNGLPADAFDRFIEELRQVTTEDIYRVANDYIQPENMRILVVGNGSEIGDQLGEFGEVNEIDISIPRVSQAENTAAGYDEL